MGRITLLVTIDTECDFDVHYHRRMPSAFTSVTVGIPALLRPLWNRYHIRPIYFVSPEVLNQEACCRILSAEVEKGAVLGAHLHSEVVGALDQTPDRADFPCYDCATAIEYEKIAWLSAKFEQRFGCRPLWYRAGRFGADLDTIRILAELGYRYDSSVSPHINWASYGGPDHRRAPEQPYWISQHDLYTGVPREHSRGILEVPVTISGKRLGFLGRWLPEHWGFYCWLRPTHMTGFEQKQLIRRMLARYRNVVLVMMFHSFEVMIGTSPYVRNRLMQTFFLKRIEAVLQFLPTCGNVSDNWPSEIFSGD